jgi:hypothetical protein
MHSAVLGEKKKHHTFNQRAKGIKGGQTPFE